MKRTVVLYVRIDEEVKDALLEVAAMNERTISATTSILLRQALNMPERPFIVDID
jgi:antitoxin component of RelBE/YafQ-DinJ toxin-antitoxin module